MTERTCRHCGKNLPIEHFRFGKQIKGYICRLCKNEKDRIKQRESNHYLRGLSPEEWREADYVATVRLGDQR
jgi:hypothetical protein